MFKICPPEQYWILNEVDSTSFIFSLTLEKNLRYQITEHFQNHSGHAFYFVSSTISFFLWVMCFWFTIKIHLPLLCCYIQIKNLTYAVPAYIANYHKIKHLFQKVITIFHKKINSSIWLNYSVVYKVKYLQLLWISQS